jgi:broad specificity phosphatase PhoE
VGGYVMTDKPATLPRIYLVRHGETDWSLAGQHTGLTDLRLTERGEQDARSLAGRLGVVEFSHVFTSPLLRARRTCELAGLGHAVETEDDAREWDYGDYEGRRSADIRQERPHWNIFRDGCPQGDSPRQITARADRLIDRLRSLAGNIALFSHGQFGRVLGVRWIGLPIDQAQHFLLATASVSRLGFGHDRSDEPAIVAWNMTAKDWL